MGSLQGPGGEDSDYLFRTVVLLGLGVMCGMFPCVLVILWLVTR